MELAAETHTARIGIVGGAGGNGKHAGACGDDLVMSGGGRDLGGGGCTGEDENGNEGANDVFHSGIPLKLYLLKKISLDNQMR